MLPLNFRGRFIMPKHHKSGTDTYTVNEVCKKLGLSRLQVFELIRKNEFRSIKVQGSLRIIKPSFDNWLFGGHNSCDSNNHKETGVHRWIPKITKINDTTYQYIDPTGNLAYFWDMSIYTSESGEPATIKEITEEILRQHNAL